MRLGWYGVVAWIALASTAQAQELGVTAEAERPMARTGGDDPSASATEIDARDRPRAMDTLEDAVREAPGARTLSTGGYGSSTTLSLRGADASQTEVLFGDVPLTSADGAAFDLSTLPLWAIGSVEVYRGGAPTFLGVSPVGGVLRLRPREARRTEAEGTLGVGSFGLGH
ncbi:MAG: TonB-dependent receptor, partial [Sandaracinaceae bacterium]